MKSIIHKAFLGLASCIFGLFSISALADTFYFVHNDHLGAPLVITDENKQVVWEVDRDPWGNITNQITNALPNNVSLPGQYYDVETGYHQNWFRDYDSSTGRYLQPDPIGLRGGINTYGYAYQNPVMFMDFMGLKVTVYGASSAQQITLQRAYDRYAGTSRGKKVVAKTADKDVRIHGNNYGWNKGEVGGNDVFIDPDSVVITSTTQGPQPASVEAKIAHEMGHIIGDEDSGEDRMDNVNANENPVREELGQPLRTSYDGTGEGLYDGFGQMSYWDDEKGCWQEL